MDPIVLAIQQAFPRIYHACHVEHRRGKSSPWRLGDHHAAILAHLDPTRGTTARELCRHLRVGAPAMSASIFHLERSGLVQRSARRGRSAARGITLTAEGCRAVGAASVLDGDRLTTLVARLTPRQRLAAVAGLRLLADAALRPAGVEASR